MFRNQLLYISMIGLCLIPRGECLGSIWIQLADENERQAEETPAVDSPISPLIINNSKLRSYFYREYMERYYYNNPGGRPRHSISRGFVDNWIDTQILHNTEMIADRLESIKDGFEIGANLLARLDKEPDRIDVRIQSRRFFKDLRDDVRNLRNRINFIISGLPSKPKGEKLNYSVEMSSAQSRLTLAKHELEEADKLIENYFFKPTHTVDVKNLKKNNMMIRLFRIEKILESLEKTVSHS